MYTFSNKSKSSNEYTVEQQYNKRQNFRLQIRKRQIDEIKRQIRKNLFVPKDANDYQLLKNINLNKLLSELKQYGPSGQLIHEMFLYATSKYSDHMFELFNGKIKQILIFNLILPSQGNQNSIKWNRQIFWILTNYTSYHNEINNEYLQKVLQIQVFIDDEQSNQNRMQNIINLQQTEQNIVLSLSNIMEQAQNCRLVLSNYSQLFYRVLIRFSNRRPAFNQLILSKYQQTPKLLSFYCELIHNLYSCIEYGQIDEKYQHRTLRQMRKILQAFSQTATMNQHDKRLVAIILDSIKRLFGHSLDCKPQILISYFSYFKKITQWFEKFIKKQTKCCKSDQIIVQYLSLLQVIYGPQIPQNIQHQVSEFYINLFNEHVGKICNSMLRVENPLFNTHTLRMLNPIFMQGYMSQLIFNEYLQVLSWVFFHVKQSTYKLKRQAMFCLVNFIKSTIYEESTYQNQILELLLTNKIADIFAFSLYSVVDIQFNHEILDGIQILLNAEQNQYGAKLKFWLSFQQAGGTLVFQKILNDQNNCSGTLKGEVNRILDIVKNHNQL